jgi:hypothetical protein
MGQACGSVEDVNRGHREHKIEKSHQTGAGDGNRTRMTSLEGWWHTLAGQSGLRP